MRQGLAVFGLFFSGCAMNFAAQPLPPQPALPEIAYVTPCDPHAVVGLTQEAVNALRARDQLLRDHIQRLEKQMHDSL